MTIVESDLAYNVLRILSEDARLSMEGIGEKLGVSRQVVGRIVRKLQEKGIIRNYATLINAAAFQTYFVEFKTNPREPEIMESLKRIPNVHALDGVIGDFSLFAKIIAKNQAEFARTLEQIDKFMTNSHFHVYRVINTIRCFKESGAMIAEEKPISISASDETILQKIRLMPQKLNLSELAKQARVGIAQSTLSKKLDKFLEMRLVRKYTICVDPTVLGLQTKFILRIKPLSLDQYTTIAGAIARLPEVIDLYRTGEDFGLLAIVRTPDIDVYNKFLQKLYQKVEIEDTHTVLVVQEWMPSILPVYGNIKFDDYQDPKREK